MLKQAFHLGITKAALAGAQLAILPGAPERVAIIAQQLANAQPLASQREFTSWLGELDGKSVVVCSTGIGGPSTSIVVEELAQMGITTFLRVGTTGAIQPHIAVGEIIISQGSVRLDGASQHFAPLAFPAVSSFECTSALVDAAHELGMSPHIGITASSDTFYPGQERYDTYSARVVTSLQNSLSEWQAMGVLNYEMESATLFTMCASQGLKAGCVAGVIVNRTQQETPTTALLQKTEQQAIATVIGAARRLV